ncbi:SMP-30/gluconolactonase/LRE family protein [Saccharolobus solfataricus]|uniref:Regucalcin homolog n=3 Tax=Saccharolobus solfataricus TaxID=2287 RepID=Q97VC7_SACS2|nr:SMP-30/gluconolactonase/LRE family protein [Saccharolobus solfataricus]AAK42817.1 Regucalcin homolog [Saccharolobus solfataricus P2]AKA72912.1 SMP-30/gluconolactonase/LRE family protein [Saccharolobus solfataricus]AKA75611.1 SMP-30/gluconolactonase/LRE family protein [Saccharolobus solfataricus]AKA78304.1 SMP-30/gluconolactonase/LRE family protein [Saccharolobus solfataricus]AZF67423.1 SMP-30/gluconolactonase/LRE family protein [Saccharolobus solfataricus]
MEPNLITLSNYKATLGEGPVYDKELNKLFWVDIEGKRIIVNDLNTGTEVFYEMPDLISSLCVIDDKRVIATIRHGFYIVNLDRGEIQKIAEVETDMESNRFNDGKCDKLGRYWAGTMNMNERKPTGSFYKLDTGKITKILEGLTVSNGLGWDPDNTQMFLIDSPVRKVFVFDFDLNKGEIYNRRVAVDFGNEPGNPDGMAVDEEGYIWVAHWGGGKVSRWNPKTGKKLFEIKVPATYVTSVTFGTQELDQLFITTAGKSQDPLAGKTFTTKANVRGLQNFRFKIS